MAATAKKKSGQGTRRTTTKAKTTKRVASAKKSTATRKSNSRSGKNTKNTKTGMGLSLAKEILIIVTFAVSVLLFISCFDLFGESLKWLKDFHFGVVGYVAYIFPFILFMSVIFFMGNKWSAKLAVKLVAILLCVLSLCGISELLFSTENSGGKVGALAMHLVLGYLGPIGSYIVMAVLLVIGLIILTEKSVVQAVGTRSNRAYRVMKEDIEMRRNEKAIRLQARALEREKQLNETRIRQQESLSRLKAATEKEVVNRLEHSVRGIADVTLKETTEHAYDVIVEDSAVTEKKPKKSRKKEEHITKEPPKQLDMDHVTIQGLAPEVVMADKDSRTQSEIESLDDLYANTSISRVGMREKPSVELPELDFAPEIFGLDDKPKANVIDNDVPEPVGIPETWNQRKAREQGNSEEVLTKTVRTASGKVITVDLDGVPGEKKRPAEVPRVEAADEDQIVVKDTYIEPKEYVFPPIDMLKSGSGTSSTAKKAMEQELKETAIKLQQTLQNFGVGVTVTNISCGPTVTRYELQPEQGVKVSKIVSLTDDIKLNLAAADIRMEAPIPGKAAIGIEVPNKENQTVMLRDMLESDEFKKHPSKVAFTAGKDIAGQTVIADIARMPHLLIAGATGSGKSVCVNTLIMSILYKAKPSEVKLIMIDPKVVELSVYNGIPHLMIPVVTDPKKAAGALNWAVAEMTNRYEKFAECNVRDMKGYNDKVDSIKEVPGEDRPKKMPQIVIIVDELADLMMVAPSDVEDAICRLAQMARAAGIHLVIATQRPSVNVITGLIKANVPSRIAFSVSSGVDSRTIIDMNGAEKLLGKGDMLFYPTGYPKPLRVQGAFVSDSEVQKVVEFLTEQKNVIGGEQNTSIDLTASSPSGSGGGAATGELDHDEYFEQAAKFIIEKEKASIGMLQRVFKIGFNRAARIMDQLAEEGIVGEDEGTKPRKVLMNLEEFDNYING